MGLTAFILGIVSLILSLFPIAHFLGVFPAIIGVILAVTDLVYSRKKADYKKGFTIAGLVLSSMALLLGTFYTVLVIVAMIS